MMETKVSHKRHGGCFTLPALILLLVLTVNATASGKPGLSTAISRTRKAGVSETTVNQLLALGYQYNLTPASVERFLKIFAHASRKGLPVEPLLIKTKEGLVKRVAPKRIRNVLAREISNELFVRQVAFKALKKWKQSPNDLSSALLIRMSKTLQMGITREEMESFFVHAPRAPLSQIANALEFLAALQQASMKPRLAARLVFSGLKTGFFAKTAWQVPIMVKMAKHKRIPEKEIATAAMGVVSGEMGLSKAGKSLGLDPSSFSQGPQFSGTYGANMGSERGNPGQSRGPSENQGMSSEGPGHGAGGDHGNGGEGGGDHGGGGDSGGGGSGGGGAGGGGAGGGEGGGHGGGEGGGHGGGDGGGHGGGDGGGGGGGGGGGH